ncbi:MAG: hypothetical protein K2Y29_05980 [Beijerinckiaceae bacterium]|nr:hypothetical protein [Beijerinckiaceae bacterium]
MVTKPSPSAPEASAVAASTSAEVARLRGMTRDERLALLMKGLDATCGMSPVRRRETQVAPAPKGRRTD